MSILNNKKEVIEYLSDWIVKSTPFKVKKMELEDNSESIWWDDYQIENLIKSAKKSPEIISIIQFGSSVSGDTYQGSDVDLLVVIKNKYKEEIEKKLREEANHNIQIHGYDKKEFMELLSKKEPIILSAIHTGKILLGKDFIKSLKDCKPTNFTVKKSMLNSFAALGMGMSDMTHGMLWDSVNSFYHAARSSIWATLMKKEVTPNNERIFELLKDEKIKKLYEEIIEFRKNIPDYNGVDSFDFDKELWQKGDFNEFTNLLSKTNFIVKKNYRTVFDKNFVDFFDLLNILKNKYKTPKFYIIMLSVRWKKMLPHYFVTLSYDNDKRIYLEVNAHTGKLEEK